MHILKWADQTFNTANRVEVIPPTVALLPILNYNIMSALNL